VKIQSIEKLFEHIVKYSYLLLPLTFLLTINKRSKDSYIIGVYGLVFFILLQLYWEVPQDLKKLYASFYTFCEYSFFSLLLYINISQKKLKNFIIVCSIGFFLFQIIYFLKVPFGRTDSISIGVESILIFVYIFLFFFEQFNNSKEKYIYNHPCFWICLGLLIYLGGSFFINILANHLSSEEFDDYWYLNYIADTIKTLLFVVAIFLFAKNSLKNHNPSSIPYLDMI
jgi:hypothetical protein